MSRDPDLMSDEEADAHRLYLATFNPVTDQRYAQKFYTYFPDDGPFARQRYAKHMEFFAAGAEYPERLFMAANRCITPWTVLETAEGERQCGELIGAGAIVVRSWDGVSRCMRPASPVFLKGIGPAFRLYLDNGETFDCSLHHRILTTAGWLSLGRLIRLADGLRYWRKGAYSQASCATDAGHDDEPLLLRRGNVRRRPPLVGGVLGPFHSIDWLPDAAEQTRARIRAYQVDARRSTLDDPFPLADLCAKFADPARNIDAEWLSDSLLNASQWRSGSDQHLAGMLFPMDLGLRNDLDALRLEPFLTLATLSSHPPLEGGAKILAVLPLGLQPILDLTVEDTECYVSRGMVSHNTGKTDGGAFEVTCHLTGVYPDWWEGRRFKHPIEAWCCGTTSETTRDIVQAKLLGPHDKPGTGMIPSHLIAESTRRPHGLPGSIESAYIKHSSGGKSLLGLKTYEQGRKSFEGTAKHVIWDDEEPPEDVYQEQLLRTLTTGGIVLVTFTPLQGMSEVVTGYLEPSDAAREVKMYVQAGWDDVPHLDERAKKQILATMLPYQIAARTKGEPSLGSGAIFPIPEADLVVPVRDFNAYSWPRAYGLDVGWNRTAAIFGTLEVSTDILYLYDEHYMGQGEPPSHAMAIRARGDWLQGTIDPAAKGRSQVDGRRLMDEYTALGLDLVTADHAVEAGLQHLWTRMITGRLKVCANCANWLREFRKYHRDEKGAIVKGNDHLMDASRYLSRSFREIMRVKPKLKSDRAEPPRRRGTWMQS